MTLGSSRSGQVSCDRCKTPVKRTGGPPDNRATLETCAHRNCGAPGRRLRSLAAAGVGVVSVVSALTPGDGRPDHLVEAALPPGVPHAGAARRNRLRARARLAVALARPPPGAAPGSSRSRSSSRRRPRTSQRVSASRRPRPASSCSRLLLAAAAATTSPRRSGDAPARARARLRARRGASRPPGCGRARVAAPPGPGRRPAPTPRRGASPSAALYLWLRPLREPAPTVEDRQSRGAARRGGTGTKLARLLRAPPGQELVLLAQPGRRSWPTRGRRLRARRAADGRPRGGDPRASRSSAASLHVGGWRLAVLNVAPARASRSTARLEFRSV